MGRRTVKRQGQPSLLATLGVPSFAEQVRRSLQAEEDERVAAASAAGEETSRREIEFPAVREGPAALAYRGRGYLERVREFDFDLTDEVFLDYARSRGVTWRPIVGDYGRAALQDCWELYLTHRAEFVQFQATTRQTYDVVVTRLPKFMKVVVVKPTGKIVVVRLTMFEVFAPGMLAPTKPYFEACYALEHAKEYAEAHGAAVWFTRVGARDSYQLIATFRTAETSAAPTSTARLGWPSDAT